MKKEIGRRIERRGYCEERDWKKDREKDREKEDIAKKEIGRRIERKRIERREIL